MSLRSSTVALVSHARSNASSVCSCRNDNSFSKQDKRGKLTFKTRIFFDAVACLDAANARTALRLIADLRCPILLADVFDFQSQTILFNDAHQRRTSENARYPPPRGFWWFDASRRESIAFQLQLLFAASFRCGACLPHCSPCRCCVASCQPSSASSQMSGADVQVHWITVLESRESESYIGSRVNKATCSA